MGVSLLATQYGYEKDSFDDQYDNDLELALEVNTADDLANALKVGGNIKLANDITAGAAFEIPAGVEVKLDLNGKTLSGAAVKQKHVLVNNGILSVANGTISSLGDDGGSAIVNKGPLTEPR